MGTMTLTSIKNFTVAGDNGWKFKGAGYFGTENQNTGQTAGGGALN